MAITDVRINAPDVISMDTELDVPELGAAVEEESLSLSLKLHFIALIHEVIIE